MTDHDIETYREPWAAVSQPQSAGQMWLRAFEDAKRGILKSTLVRRYNITADQASELIQRAKGKP